MELNAYVPLHCLLIICDCTTSKHMLFNSLGFSFFAKCNICQDFLKPRAQELYLDNLLYTIFLSEKQFHTLYIGCVDIQYAALQDAFMHFILHLHACQNKKEIIIDMHNFFTKMGLKILLFQ